MAQPRFQGINRLFVLTFENDVQRISKKRYYLPNVEIKGYNVMIDGKNIFYQPVKNDKITYDNIRKIASGQGNGYTTGSLLDYFYLKDLSKQQALDTDPRAIQQINFNADYIVKEVQE